MDANMETPILHIVSSEQTSRLYTGLFYLLLFFWLLAKLCEHILVVLQSLVHLTTCFGEDWLFICWVHMVSIIKLPTVGHRTLGSSVCSGADNFAIACAGCFFRSLYKVLVKVYFFWALAIEISYWLIRSMISISFHWFLIDSNSNWIKNTLIG